MRTDLINLAVVMLAGPALALPQATQLKTADAVLERYQQALGGVDAIAKVQSLTVHGDIEGTGIKAKLPFVYRAKPFKTLMNVTAADGGNIVIGFDGSTSWSLRSNGASIDKDTPVEAVRRDADLQYPLHQPDYFRKLEFAGVTDFEGRQCYWLHGTTHWGKDNNQFYDVETGLLAGYRFQTDNSSSNTATALFEDYKNFGGPLMTTKLTTRTGDRFQTFHYRSVSYDPLEDSLFELPQAVKALLK